MPDILLKVVLPKNRNESGTMSIIVDGKTIRSYEALGRGSRGPGDTQLQQNGNTPTGTFRSSLRDTSHWPQSSYGPNGALTLDPVSGNAVRARDDEQRSGLLIHGGDLGGPRYWRGEAQLRATYGCLRVSNDDMSDLVSSIRSLSYNENTRTCEWTNISVDVSDKSSDTSDESVNVSSPR